MMENTPYRFSAGNDGTAQRKIIRHLLSLYDNGFSTLSELERLKQAGTPAIRAIAKPVLNPIQSISELRGVNGDDCLLTSRVGVGQGRRPGYYSLPLGKIQLWKDALKGESHD